MNNMRWIPKPGTDRQQKYNDSDGFQHHLKVRISQNDIEETPKR
jgi:hypothetical protein